MLEIYVKCQVKFLSITLWVHFLESPLISPHPSPDQNRALPKDGSGLVFLRLKDFPCKGHAV